jgi:hypothetical protein
VAEKILRLETTSTKSLMKLFATIAKAACLVGCTTAVALTSCTSTAVIAHPEFAQKRSAIHKIAVVTPNVEFARQTVVAAHRIRQPESERSLRRNILDAAARELTTNGFAVELPIWETLARTLRAGIDCSNLNEAIVRASAREFVCDPRRFREPTNNAWAQDRSDAQLLAAAAAADALLFVSLHGYETTAGRKTVAATVNTLSILAAGGGGGGGSGSTLPFLSFSGETGIQVLLVEGSTGEPLWANAVVKSGNGPHVDKMIHELFEPLRNFAQRKGTTAPTNATQSK